MGKKIKIKSKRKIDKKNIDSVDNLKSIEKIYSDYDDYVETQKGQTEIDKQNFASLIKEDGDKLAEQLENNKAKNSIYKKEKKEGFWKKLLNVLMGW